MKLPAFFAHLKKASREFLDHPGRRWLLEFAFSFHILIKARRFVKVCYDDGVWVQKDNSGIIVDWKPNYTHSLSKFESATVDYYCHTYRPRPGDIVIDIGAGIGAETYYFSKSVGPQGEVISIEAQPRTFLCLSKFCQYNQLTNVNLINTAISDKQGQALMSAEANHISNSILNSPSGVMVKTIPLDLITERLGLNEIDFIKMNIEGAEKLAIQGMSRTLGMTRSVCICCHDFKADRDGNESLRTKSTIRTFLIKNGFKITSRNNDDRPWVRDHLYGINLNLPPRLQDASTEMG